MSATNRSPDEIERDIHKIRADIDDTLESLQRKLSPGQLLDQALGYARENSSVVTANAAAMATNAGRTVRDNPIPVALMCVGLAWLMFGSRGSAYAADAPRRSWDSDRGRLRPASPRSGNGQAGSRARGDDGPGLRQRAEDLADSARRRVEAAGDAVAERASALGDRASGVADRASDLGDRASAAAGRVGESARRAQEEIGHAARATGRYAQEHPLMVGALLLGVGAAVAALLPRTRAEDRLMGDASDRVKSDVRQEVESAASQAGDAALAAVKEGEAEAKRRDLTPERARREAAEVTQAGVGVAKAAVRAAEKGLKGEPADTKRTEAGDDSGKPAASQTDHQQSA